MEIKSKKLFDLFYEEVAKDKYPELTRTQLILICYVPFKYLRKAISSGNMPIIHFKYLGKFKPHLFKIIKYARQLDNNMYVSSNSDGFINSKKYFIRNYLNKVICEIDDRNKNIENLKLKIIDNNNYKRLINLFNFKWFYDKNKKQTEETDLYQY
jgi:hypothetical protein